MSTPNITNPVGLDERIYMLPLGGELHMGDVLHRKVLLDHRRPYRCGAGPCSHAQVSGCVLCYQEDERLNRPKTQGRTAMVPVSVIPSLAMKGWLK